MKRISKWLAKAKAKFMQNPFVYLFTMTWKYSKGNRRNVAIYWSCFIVAMLITLFFTPLLGAKILNVVQTQGVTSESISTLLVLLVAIFFVKMVFWAFHGPARVLETLNAFKARANYRKFLLKGVTNLPMEWHVEHHSGDTIDKVEKGTTSIYQFSEDSFVIVYAVVQFIGSCGMLAYFCPTSIPIVLVMMAISIWITMRSDRVMIPQYKQLSKAENEISESTFDTISNIATVIILRVERLVLKAIEHKIDKPYELYKNNTIRNEKKWFLTTVCTQLMIMFVLAVYFWQNLNGSKAVLIGTVYILINYLNEVGETFFRFTGLYSDVVKRTARIQNAEILSEDFKPENYTNHVLPSDWQKLEVKDLDFTYTSDVESENGAPHLSEIAVTIRRGARIALVGESGSGKTTFLKIMRDLYRPQNLTFSVDGTEINDGFGGISQAIALVPQNPEIFGTTIIENITLGAEYDQSTIKEFTDMACFTNVVEKLPKKLESSIKERGVNLSGGQQQRLALARGLLACQDKDVVLLDEPTASLDTATEMSVYRNIFKAFKGKTVISSIHRLHLLPMFDEIHFFDQGKIIATGTLSELRETCPKFQELWAQYHNHKEVSFV